MPKSLSSEKTAEQAHAQDANPKQYNESVLTNKLQVANYMRTKRKADEERITRAKAADSKANPRPSLVVLRAHENATFKMVNEVLEGCRMANYTDVQLRAIVGKAN